MAPYLCQVLAFHLEVQDYIFSPLSRTSQRSEQRTATLATCVLKLLQFCCTLSDKCVDKKPVDEEEGEKNMCGAHKKLFSLLEAGAGQGVSFIKKCIRRLQEPSSATHTQLLLLNLQDKTC